MCLSLNVEFKLEFKLLPL